MSQFQIPKSDAGLVDALVFFARTPEWSVSMLEDIDAMVREVREVGPDLAADDPAAWVSH